MSTFTDQEAEAYLKPQFEKYIEIGESKDWEGVAAYYHPNCVLVQKGKEAHYGRDAAKGEFIKFDELGGDATSTFSNVHYQGTGDYLIITANYSTKTEKIGTINGKFVQIWKKEGDRHLIYHDEFEIIA
ncbi:hypothetical protein B9Z55_017680 [Caenorhabditis nigoni]|uniref:DUF4440 domain-containing protein n=1 Tax=Caenorhabditis nigoni TaxID=1611254 RepID=A0A2G5TAS4_9PELO|nr:hypothetical protein B9Z55_017680 [Caenorhabditis nigoni]